MGSIESRNELPDKKNFHILDYGYCRVWKRKVDSLQIMEEYPVYIESEERLKSFENVWPLRTNHPLFVNVYHFSHSQPGKLCGGAAKGSLFIERIPYRLSELANIKYPEIVCIMKACIQGYKVLYDSFGRFFIRSTMIGFTQNFQVKLWFHTDFSEPEPENPNCKNLQEMFTSLINSVESTCQHLYYNCPRFSQFIVQTNYVYLSKDFDWLYKGLDEYVRKLNISKSSSLMSLINCIKQPEGWEKFKAKNNYPKLLLSEVEMPPEASSSQKNVQTSRKSLQNQSIIPQTHVKIPSSELKKTLSSNALEIGTTDRMFKTFEKDQHQVYHQSNNYAQPNSPIVIQTQRNQQLMKKEEMKFWRSSQKINLNQAKIINPAIITGESSVNRFHSSNHKMNPKEPSKEYYGQIQSNAKQVSHRKSAQMQNDKLVRKSFDLSTETRNRDKSTTSQFSLIEDLQTNANKTNPNLKFKHL